MLRKKPRWITPQTLGILFLLPGLVLGVPTLMFGTLSSGGLLGFSLSAVVLGLILHFLPIPTQKE